MTVLLDKARSMAARRRERRGDADEAGDAGARATDGVAQANDGAAQDGTAQDGAGQDGASQDGADSANGVMLLPPASAQVRLRGRKELLAHLDALLWAPNGRTHVLAGPGGAGKTAIASRLARAAASRGVPAWWVPATDAQTVMVRMLELAACIGARPGELAQAKTGQRDAADLLWQYLEERAPWLLVVDGADDPAALAVDGSAAASGTGWLRRTQGGLVIVTTRYADTSRWGRHTEVHRVGPLDPAAGGKVLADFAPGAGSAREAAALSELLGGLPLALRHAGAQLAAGSARLLAAEAAGQAPQTAAEAAGGQTFGGYARALIARGGGAGGDGGDRAIVASTRELALEALAGGAVPQARPLLRVLGCLAPAVPIPASMLDLDVLARVCEGERKLAADGLRGLVRAGLVTAAPGGGVIVHRLVSETSRVYTGDAARAGGVAVALLAAAAGGLEATRGGLDGLDGIDALAEPKDWPAWVELQPHVSAVCAYLGGVLGEADLATLTTVAAATALAYLSAGFSAAAAELAAAALRHARRLGAEHEGVLALRNAVVRARSHQAPADGAERELLDLLAAQVRVLGPDHPDTLGSAHQLGRLLARQGQYETAELWLRGVLAAHARTLGPDHPSTLTARHDFGLVLAQRGEYALAAREFADLLAAQVRVLGPEHRDTRVTRRWLAHVRAADATVRSG